MGAWEPVVFAIYTVAVILGISFGTAEFIHWIVWRKV
ncbi:hypothetical protein JG068_016 [Burkholderia phage JG068]|uniref:Uncharacterized protein n=1 Tax=Burkholderia phage JG068 TaxID=1401297 RepID=U3PCJ0_9CAUD|nr:hypothetical protein JG068_016 [Burkholderia phage JG068]AGW43598.1 hypothetical protein JG068_016 [Burkholderia phage JG068]